jgi:hypothetical protein
MHLFVEIIPNGNVNRFNIYIHTSKLLSIDRYGKVFQLERFIVSKSTKKYSLGNLINESFTHTYDTFKTT